MRIKDENGRIGEITEQRDTGVFARPDNVLNIIPDTKGITGITEAKLITSTFWHLQQDGSYRGLWFDSPDDKFITAQKINNLLTTIQAASILNINQSRVRQFILAKRLPAQKIGRDWIIKEQDLEKVKNRKVGRPKMALKHLP